jgi:hypothetical protein
MIEPNELAHEVSEDLLEITIGEMLEHGSFGFFLPYQYSAWGTPPGSADDGIGGKVITEPLTIYASVDVFGDDDRVTFKTTIAALLDEVHEGYVSWESGQLLLDSADLEMLTNIRDALAKEVSRVDEWIRTAELTV